MAGAVTALLATREADGFLGPEEPDALPRRMRARARCVALFCVRVWSDKGSINRVLIKLYTLVV